MFTTVQQVREAAGFQNYRIDSPLRATGNSTIWNNSVKDLERFVPRSNSGATVAAVTDLYIKYNGASVGFSAIDSISGDITLGTGYATGSSLVGTFASSPVSTAQIFNYITNANSKISAYVSKQYTVPLGVCVPLLNDLETKLAAGNLLINSYGISGKDSAEDGYRMVEEADKILVAISEGELPLVNNSGDVVGVDATIASGGNASGGSGTRVKGYLFTTDQEQFKVISRDEYTASTT